VQPLPRAWIIQIPRFKGGVGDENSSAIQKSGSLPFDQDYIIHCAPHVFYIVKKRKEKKRGEGA